MKTLSQPIRKLTKEQFLALKDLCRHSNSLYNQALYCINHHYEQANSYIGYAKLYHELKTSEHYTAMPAKIAQQTLRLADKDMRSFFSILHQKRQGKYQGDIGRPRYKKPNSFFNLILPNDQVTMKNKTLKLTKHIKLPFTYDIKGTIKQLIVRPHMGGKHFSMCLQYEEATTSPIALDKNRFLSIDLGIDNLAACASNVGPSFLLNGRPLKSYNQFYNKRMAAMRSELERTTGKKWSRAMERLSMKRSRWISNYFDQSVALLMKYCLKYNIGRVILGYNAEWKQNVNIGQVNNQKFMSIPHFLLKRKLQDKCESIGIEILFQEESYTSKASFLDVDAMEHGADFSGRRIKRGLYRSADGRTLNADINGALNIARKVFPEFSDKGIEVFIVGPVSLMPLARRQAMNFVNKTKKLYGSNIGISSGEDL